MEKIIFFGLVIPILGFVLYLGATAIMKGFSAKSENKKNESITGITIEILPAVAVIPAPIYFDERLIILNENINKVPKNIAKKSTTPSLKTAKPSEMLSVSIKPHKTQTK